MPLLSLLQKVELLHNKEQVFEINNKYYQKIIRIKSLCCHCTKIQRQYSSLGVVLLYLYLYKYLYLFIYI